MGYLAARNNWQYGALLTKVVDVYDENDWFLNHVSSGCFYQVGMEVVQDRAEDAVLCEVLISYDIGN